MRQPPKSDAFGWELVGVALLALMPVLVAAAFAVAILRGVVS